MRREAIQRTLAQRTGGAPDATAIADAIFSTWSQISARLAPLIGGRGVDVLFSRSLHVTNKAFPWLAITGDHGDSAALLAAFKARIGTYETAVAAEVSTTLLVTFTELLATLIGESLTERLLEPVWVPPSRKSEQENIS